MLARLVFGLLCAAVVLSTGCYGHIHRVFTGEGSDAVPSLEVAVVKTPPDTVQVAQPDLKVAAGDVVEVYKVGITVRIRGPLMGQIDVIEKTRVRLVGSFTLEEGLVKVTAGLNPEYREVHIEGENAATVSLSPYADVLVSTGEAVVVTVISGEARLEPVGGSGVLVSRQQEARYQAPAQPTVTDIPAADFNALLQELSVIEQADEGHTYVPLVLGETPDEARRLLEQAMLVAAISPTQTVTASGAYEIGTVSTQSAAWGSPVAVDSTVRLTLEGEPVTVPDLTRLSEDDAQDALRDLGLVLAWEEVLVEGLQAPLVVQDPEPDTAVAAGATVSVRHQLPAVAVPVFVGKTVSEAKILASQSALLIHGVTQIATRNRAQHGRVASQSLDAGVLVREDSAITLEVYVYD